MTIPTGKEPIDPDASQPGSHIYRPYPSDGNVIDDHLPTLGGPTGHEAEFEHNAEERCAVVLVLDTSNSMKGEPIKLLNEAIKQFHRNLTEDSLIAIKVDIGMVTFKHNRIYTDFVNATEFKPPVMHASGGTKLSFALSAALDMVAKRKGNCSAMWGSGDYSASCGGTTKHGISTANRFRPLKREQLHEKMSTASTASPTTGDSPTPGAFSQVAELLANAAPDILAFTAFPSGPLAEAVVQQPTGTAEPRDPSSH